MVSDSESSEPCACNRSSAVRHSSQDCHSAASSSSLLSIADNSVSILSYENNNILLRASKDVWHTLLTLTGNKSQEAMNRRRWKSETASKKRFGVNCNMYELKAWKSYNNKIGRYSYRNVWLCYLNIFQAVLASTHLNFAHFESVFDGERLDIF